MYRSALCVVIPVLLLASTAAHSSTPWPNTYTFFGRWDLHTAKRAVTVSSGSYVKARFSGASLDAAFDLSRNSTYCEQEKPAVSSFPTIAWQIDDGIWHEAEIAASVKLAEGLPKGKHTVMLMVRGLDEHQNRWTSPLVASVTFTGFQCAKGGKLESALSRWKKPTLTMEFLGDSITEGVLVDEGRAGVVDGIPRTWPWLSDARLSYAAQTAMALGAEWRQVGFGATGLMHGGSGGALGALDTFNWFYADCPRDNWQPDVVVVNHGTNDGSMAPAEYEPLYARYLAMMRTAYPKARIVALRPFCGAQETAIKAVVDACHAAGDTKVYYIDTTGWYDGPIHPNIEGSTGLAEKLVKVLKAQVLTRK